MKSKTQKMKLLNKRQTEFNDFVLNKVTPLFDVRNYKFDMVNPNLLQEKWEGDSILLVIPYGDRMEPWLARVISECYSDPKKFIVVVMGAKVNTNAWHRLVFPYAEEISFVLKGKRPCAICVFGHGLEYVAFQDNDVSNIFSTSGTAAPQLWKHKPGESIEESMDDTTFLTDNEE